MSQNKDHEKNDEDMEDFYEPMNDKEYPEDNSKQHTKRLSVLCDI